MPISNLTLTHGKGSGDGSKGNPVAAARESRCGFVLIFIWVCVGLCGRSCGFVLIFVWLDFGLGLG